MYEFVVERARGFDPAFILCETFRRLALGYKLFLGEYPVVLCYAMKL